MVYSYNIEESKNKIMNCLGHEGLRFVQMLTHNEQEMCQTSPGLFETLSLKSKPHHNDPMSLMYCKLVREEKESAEKSMGHLCVKVKFGRKSRRTKNEKGNTWDN